MRHQLQRHTKTCLLCEKSFLAERSDARFCSSSCRSLYSRRKRNLQVKNSEQHARAVAVVEYKSFEPERVWETAKPEKTFNTDPEPYFRDIRRIIGKEEFISGSFYGSTTRTTYRRYHVLYFWDQAMVHTYIRIHKLNLLHRGKLIIEGHVLYIPDRW